MNFFTLWSTGEMIALVSLVVGTVGALAAAMVVPEVRRFLRLDNPHSSSDRKRRRSLFFIFVGLWLVVGLIAWRMWIEPKLVKWEVVQNLVPEQAQVDEVPIVPSPTPTPTPQPPSLPATESPEPLPSAAVEVIKGTRTEDNLGGGTVIVDMWDAKTVQEVSTSQITALFEPIVEPDALVNLAIRGTVRVHEVRLSTVNRRFRVAVKVENLTDSAVIAEIPKGQVFENKRPKQRRQNLAASQRMASIRLPPRVVVQLDVDALCINQNWKPPSGDEGNITVLKIREGNFSGQQDLWAKIRTTITNYKEASSGE